jgi:superfamily II DNA/RNA helicase
VPSVQHIKQHSRQAMQLNKAAMQTLAFLLPVLTMAVHRLEQRVQGDSAGDDMGPEAIIIAPSRELAMQIVRVAQRLLPQEAWPLVQQAIGGANMRRQVESMKGNKPLIVIGTPGRMAEHSRAGTLRTHRTAAVVLDEVDQLLCQQFRDDMLRILAHTGSKLPEGPQYVRATCHAPASSDSHPPPSSRQ